MEYVKRKEALKMLNISYPTLYKMAENNEIDTIKVREQMMYNVNKYLRENKIENTNKKNICYCRVSSKKQMEDLKRQVAYMERQYPHHRIITDIGSGLNYKRAGLREIMDMAVNGEINELVIAYKDRLTRFGYELIEYQIEKYSGGKIKIINNEEEKTPTEELTEDVITIMNVYVAKINGLRKYKNKMRDEITGKNKQTKPK